MPQKSIYIKDEDVEIFDRAEAIPEASLSSVIAKALRDFIARHDAQEQKVEKHIIEVGIWGGVDKPNDDDNTKKVSFYGVFIGSHRENLDRAKNGTKRRLWRAYITQKGQPLVWCKYETQWAGDRDMADYVILDKDSLDNTFMPNNIEEMWSPSNENFDTTPINATIPISIMSAIRKAISLSDIEELDV